LIGVIDLTPNLGLEPRASRYHATVARSLARYHCASREIDLLIDRQSDDVVVGCFVYSDVRIMRQNDLGPSATESQLHEDLPATEHCEEDQYTSYMCNNCRATWWQVEISVVQTDELTWPKF
jgi:hypothetical protein